MAYGMTEGLGLTALRGDEWLAHPGSVGRDFRDTEVRILDQHGQPVAAGELGEVYLRSPMSAGYLYLGGAPLLPSTPDGSGPPVTSVTSTTTAICTSPTDAAT